MVIIDRIGAVNILRHGAVYIVADRTRNELEIFTSERDARDRALERVDLVDALQAIAIH